MSNFNSKGEVHNMNSKRNKNKTKKPKVWQWWQTKRWQWCDL